MHRIEGVFADRTTGRNLFKKGPPGTKITDDWLNAVQEEICGIVEHVGLALKTAITDIGHDQLLLAIGMLGIGGVPIGTEMLMHHNAAPVGWVIMESGDDLSVMITPGSYAGGAVGGELHPSGTWGAPGHTLTEDEIPSHMHTVSPQWQAVADGPRLVSTVPYLGMLPTDGAEPDLMSTYSGGDGTHSHGGGGAWRPAAECFILCSKELFYL